MNARVFLVVLLTATFMAVWDADQKAMNAALARKQQSSDRLNHVAVTRNQPRLDKVKNLPDRRFAVGAKGHDTSDCFIPVPRNLATGTWNAIAESGEIYTITIGRTSAAGFSSVAADESLEECFTLSNSACGDRWCFVRSHTGMLSEPRSASTENDTPVK
jgi:hypothetical protein